MEALCRSMEARRRMHARSRATETVRESAVDPRSHIHPRSRCKASILEATIFEAAIRETRTVAAAKSEARAVSRAAASPITGEPASADEPRSEPERATERRHRAIAVHEVTAGVRVAVDPYIARTATRRDPICRSAVYGSLSRILRRLTISRLLIVPRLRLTVRTLRLIVRSLRLVIGALIVASRILIVRRSADTAAHRVRILRERRRPNNHRHPNQTGEQCLFHFLVLVSGLLAALLRPLKGTWAAKRKPMKRKTM